MSSYLPNLIEPGTKYFLDSTLKNCKKIKDKYYYYIFNASPEVAVCREVASCRQVQSFREVAPCQGVATHR